MFVRDCRRGTSLLYSLTVRQDPAMVWMRSFSWSLPVTLCLVTCATVCQTPAVADGPADNKGEQVRPVPPPGIALPDADKDALTSGQEPLQAKLDELQKPHNDKKVAAFRKAHIADVAVL